MTYAANENLARILSRTAKTSLFAQVKNWLVQSYRLEKKQHELRQLAKLDDEQLRDMGLTKGDAMWAANQPPQARAGHKLTQIRAQG